METLKPDLLKSDIPSSLQEPSKWWCSWQALKGTNFTHLELPAAQLRDKWVIVTGGNNGIGREATLQFAGWGANIILLCRQPPAHEISPDTVIEECKVAAQAAGHPIPQVEWWKCDMADLATVEAVGKRWLKTGRPLDLLINNAGMSGSFTPVVRTTKDGFGLVHQVNMLSHVLLTMTLLPSLSQSREARIVCTTSCVHFNGTFNPANINHPTQDYANNKLYFQIWLTELQRLMLEHSSYKSISIHGVHPGFVNSSIWDPSDKTTTLPVWVNWILDRLLRYVAITPQQGSLAILKAATAPEFGPDPATQGVGHVGARGGGRYLNRIWDNESMPHTKDENCRRIIWNLFSEELKLRDRGLLDVLDA